MTDETVVERALRAVLRDYGWRLVTDTARLRATLSDVLGADAAEYRGLVDALVVAVDQGVLTDLSGGEHADADLERRLESWGLRADRAAWAVAAWKAVVPAGTDPAPVTAPSPRATDPGAPGTAGPAGPSAQPEAVAAVGPTALPPAHAGLPRTALPPTAPPMAPPAPPPAAPAYAAASPSPAPRPSILRSRAAIAAMLAVGAVAVAGGGFVVLQQRGGHGHPASGSSTAPHTPASVPASDALLVSAAGVTPRALPHPVGMGADKVGVSLTSLSDVASVTTHGQTLVPPAGGRLVAFSLGRWACQEHTTCARGHAVDVEVNGSPRPLRGAGPYVVAVPADATSADLVMTANGITQRISLLTGKAAAGNIEVFQRSHRMLHLNRTFDVTQTTSISIYYVNGLPGSYQHTLNVTIEDADLDYFVAGQTPRNGQFAFLFVNCWYTHQEDPDKKDHRWAFGEPSLTFVARDGTRYPARDLTGTKSYATQVFEVPASIRGGRFVIGGPEAVPQKATDGTSYTMSIAPHAERFVF